MQQRPDKGQLCGGVCSVYTVERFSGSLHREGGLGLESTFRTLWLPIKPVLWLISTNSFQFSPIPGQEEASRYSMTNQGWTDASNRGIWSPLWVTVINISRCSVESEWEPCDLTGNNRRRIFTEPFRCARRGPRSRVHSPCSQQALLTYEETSLRGGSCSV